MREEIHFIQNLKATAIKNALGNVWAIQLQSFIIHSKLVEIHMVG